MPGPNPNHHLWRNGRLWWIAFTVLYDGWRQERIRRSLGTANLDEARRLRDELLGQFAAQPRAEVAALRLRARVPRELAIARQDETTPFRVDLAQQHEPNCATA